MQGAPEVSIQTAPPAPVQSDTPPQITEQAPVLNEFEKLAAQSRWSELTALCETRLSDATPESHEARLWWVRAQLESRQLPVNLLIAPLEAATSSVTTGVVDARIRALAGGILAKAAAASSKSTDGELCVALLQKAAAIDACHQHELVAAIDEEDRRLRSQDGLSSAQQAQRDARLEQLKRMRPAGVNTPEQRVLALARAASNRQGAESG
ncbi:MAG: hypothetical protein EBZ48_05960 [Proteobacteria bacterium]|nr:hypothetical protein [Pseudomonadota bacterium]